EDGIRDFHVTGVQTCALPICDDAGQRVAQRRLDFRAGLLEQREERAAPLFLEVGGVLPIARRDRGLDLLGHRKHVRKIDLAACRRSKDSIGRRAAHVPALPMLSQPALISRTSDATSSSAATSFSKFARRSTRDMYS